MMFDIVTTPRILFGPGTTYRLGDEAKLLGNKVLLVSGQKTLQNPENNERVLRPLKQAGLQIIHFDEVRPEPTTTMVDKGRALARDEKCDLVIGVGGGSALDVAKAIAGLFNEDGPASDYLAGRQITTLGLPWIAVPTTAGSGSEVTRNSVLINPEMPRKDSIRNDFWIPRVAVVDPILTMSMSPQLTAYTGMDALTHAIEAYTSRWTTAWTSGLAREAVRLIVQNFYTCYNANKKEAREKMMLGSMMAGTALNNARAGAVHALAHPVGLKYGLSHGLVCGTLLPYVMAFNKPITRDRYADLAYASGIVTQKADPDQAAEKLIYFVKQLRTRLGLPEKLGALGLKKKDIPKLVEDTLPSGSLAANARKATRDDLYNILEQNI
ncbi:MAG: iron-containing alcohol dehydrogenase [Peptococcaceae bacterium]|nr:iron-containing alcohol dehydrogenase [Peptococcaceae bacterium]